MLSNKPTQSSIAVVETVPFVSGPLIDKLSVCVNYTDPDLRQDIRVGLYQQANDVSAGIISASGKSGGYKIGLRLHFPLPEGTFSRDHALIQADPYNQSAPFIRCEFNPAKAGPSGIDELKLFLLVATPGGYKDFIASGRVTRLDLAVDVPGVDVDRICIRFKRTRAGCVFTGADGGLETLYSGRSRGNQLVVYDRLKKLGKKEAHCATETVTRIEVRLKE